MRVRGGTLREMRYIRGQRVLDNNVDWIHSGEGGRSEEQGLITIGMVKVLVGE